MENNKLKKARNPNESLQENTKQQMENLKLESLHQAYLQNREQSIWKLRQGLQDKHAP